MRKLEGLKEADSELAAQIARMSSASAVQDWIATLLARSDLAEPARVTLWKAIRLTGVKRMPLLWNAAMLQALKTGSTPEVLREVLGITAALPAEAREEQVLKESVLKVAQDEGRLVEFRLAALEALPRPFAVDADGALFTLAAKHAGTDQPVEVRQRAARVIGSQPLNARQRQILLGILPGLGPMELNQVLGGLAEPLGDASDLLLIDAVGSAKAFRSIPVDRLRTTFAKYPEAAKPKVAALIAQLDEGFGEKQKRIDALLADLKGGDVVRGQAIFNSPKAVCSSCHAIGYLGGDIGPDLTRIGQIRNERDLLEAIVYPSASFVRSYESVRVLTKNGEDHQGVVREDASDHVTLATGPNVTVKVARSDIAEMQPGNLSIMPAGLDEQLSRQELADLLAFLKATRW
jgi:putative heme-binding domain-containing protein